MHTDEDAIRHLIEYVYPTTANSGDADAYAALYTDDALWSPPNAPDRRGPANIRFGYIAKNAAIDAKMNVDEHLVIGDIGWVSALAHVVVMPRDGSPAVTYYYRGNWRVRKVMGQWKIERQIWTEKPAAQVMPIFGLDGIAAAS